MRKLVPTAAVIACCLGGPATVAAQVPTTPPAPVPPPKPEPRIKAGVTSAGVALQGLTVAEATARLKAEARPRMQRRFRVRVGRRTFVLTTGRLRLRFAERSTARRALKAKPGRAVSPVISFRAASLSAFAQRTEQVTRRYGRNASMRITVRRIIGRKARYGSRISAARLDKAIRRRVANPALSRGLAPKVFRVRPAVRLIDLRRRNRTILTIDRSTYRLRLFKNLRYDRSYGIAVGAAGTETPPGLYRIQNKQVNPAWTAPNRPWAGSYAGRTIPGGAPDNPLKARWLGIAGGVGIHGTAEAWSIGSRASHGCIRMRVPEVIDLFGRVPVGSPVLIR